MADEATLQFASNLHQEVLDRAETSGQSDIEAFASMVLELFEVSGILEEPELCVTAGKIGRMHWEVAGWAFPPSEDEDLTQIGILALHFLSSASAETVVAEDLRRRFELAVNFIEAMLDGRADEFEPAADIAALGRLIYARRRQLKKIVVHLATDGLTARLKSIQSKTLGNIEIECWIWDVERLSRLGDPKQEEIDVDVRAVLDGQGLPCLVVPEEDPSYEAYLCVVPGRLLYEAYEQYGQRLLELNVRAFLAATGKVNKGIRDTIREAPDRFFPYNNGLAITARRVEVAEGRNGQLEIVRLVGMQIVNGGQTTASIHRAWKLDGAAEKVARVFVQAKVTVITTPEGEDDEFIDIVRNISKFANSQNAVKADDLEANQPWHVVFEKLSRNVWTPDAQSHWYYERTRGGYATEKARAAIARSRRLEFERRFPRAQLITKTDLAKCWNAWAQKPEIVSLGGQKNFKNFMDSLDVEVRRPSLDEKEFQRIVGRVILLRETTQVVNSMKAEIPAYRANVVAYLVAYLSSRMPTGLDFDRIWERQAVPEAVKDVLRAWAVPMYRKIIETAGDRNVTEWCKKSDCWRAVRACNFPTHVDLTRFSAADGRGQQSGLLDASDAAVVSECMRLTTAEWESLCAWSMRQPNLHFTVRGVLSTLRGYALGGWDKRPSVRQARAAARQIKQWREDDN